MPNHVSQLAAIKPALFLTVSALLLPSTALAVNEIRPGQWETSVQVQGMPAISADQLEQLRQFGIELPVSGNAIVTQQCITPEQAKLKQPLLPQTEDGCSVRNYQQQGSQLSGELLCNGNIKGNGRFDMTLLSDSAFEGKLSMQGSAQGLPINQNSSVVGKWVKAKCDAELPTYQP